MHRPNKSTESILKAIRAEVIADPSVAGLLAGIPSITLTEYPFGPRRNGANWDLDFGTCDQRIAASIQAAKARMQEEFDVTIRPPGTGTVG